MFIGHFAVALAAKRATPTVSLGALTVAALLLDLVWPVLVLLGIEHVLVDPGNTRLTPLDFTHYPFTHSLLMVLLWSALAGGLYLAWRRDRKAALVIGLLVLSHWVLDLLTHRPDLPLAPGASPRVGLGLWNVPAAAIFLESALFLAGVWLYLRATRERDFLGRWGFLTYAALLALIYVMNLTAPPPPSGEAVAWTALAAWLFPLWAWWFDRHRAPSRP
jgi:membrane-bound metal-dependent hydrolase YbcI (DUF457 family)